MRCIRSIFPTPAGCPIQQSSSADDENRVVVTKDADFVTSHTLNGQPRSLLLIATGNIGNAALEALLRGNLAQIAQALDKSLFVELGKGYLTSHGQSD